MPEFFESNGAGGWIWHDTPVVRQLSACGALPGLIPVEVTQSVVRATATCAALTALASRLKLDHRFAHGVLHGLHADIGPNRQDFRSYRGSLGKGSLQIVLDCSTGKFYADVDRFSPYEDLVGWFGHSGEVLRGWWRRLKEH